jgi:hypothetical protein
MPREPFRRPGSSWLRLTAFASATVLNAIFGAAPMSAQQTAADSAVTACLAADTSQKWQQVGAAWSAERAGSWSNDALRQRLIAMAARDQAVRLVPNFSDSVRDSAFVHRMTAVDQANADSLTKILAHSGWPTKSMVGARGASAAFLIAQHNEALQEPALALMRALPAGEVFAGDMAMLDDRVRVRRGEPQLYGTQLPWSESDTLRFYPIADIDGLDARRASAGLSPLSTYLCMMERMYGRKIADPRVKSP